MRWNVWAAWSVESRIRPNGGFGETPGKLSQVKLTVTPKGEGAQSENSLPGQICETPLVDSTERPRAAMCEMRHDGSFNVVPRACARVRAGAAKYRQICIGYRYIDLDADINKGPVSFYQIHISRYRYK